MIKIKKDNLEEELREIASHEGCLHGFDGPFEVERKN
jgi:hypothetical protein